MEEEEDANIGQKSPGKLAKVPVPPAFKKPTSRTLAPRGNKGITPPAGRSVSPEQQESASQPAASPGAQDAEEQKSPNPPKRMSFGLADLINDDDDEDGNLGLFLDGSQHHMPPPKPLQASKFKPISSWATPAEDERSGPKRSKKKGPVASVKRSGKVKGDRMKPQRAGDDSSIVKLRKKGTRKKGELSFEKSADKSKTKSPKDKDSDDDDGGVRKGWLNPFDISAGEHHYEIGTC